MERVEGQGVPLQGLVGEEGGVALGLPQVDRLGLEKRPELREDPDPPCGGEGEVQGGEPPPRDLQEGQALHHRPRQIQVM